jgi:hypothetical protein
MDKLTKAVSNKLDAVKKEITSAENLSKIGSLVSESIFARTLQGYGLGGNLEPLNKLKPLAESTKKSRKKEKHLSPVTTPAKSNLTRTGAMLQSIDYKVNIDSVTISVAADQKDKVQWNADKGREFLYISKKEFNSVVDFIKQKMLTLIK